MRRHRRPTLSVPGDDAPSEHTSQQRVEARTHGAAEGTGTTQARIVRGSVGARSSGCGENVRAGGRVAASSADRVAMPVSCESRSSTVIDAPAPLRVTVTDTLRSPICTQANVVSPWEWQWRAGTGLRCTARTCTVAQAPASCAFACEAMCNRWPRQPGQQPNKRKQTRYIIGGERHGRTVPSIPLHWSRRRRSCVHHHSTQRHARQQVRRTRAPHRFISKVHTLQRSCTAPKPC